MSNKGFKPGDLVVCINDVYKTRYISEGNIYKISNIDVYQFIYLEEAEGIRFNKSRFKLYEKPEETPKPQFKVDDLVEYTGDSDLVIGLHKGAVYKIYNLCFGGYVRLYEFVQGPAFELKKFKPYKSPKEVNKTTFEVGAVVEAFGVRGKVVNVLNDAEYPIEVKFVDGTQTCWFLKEGKYQTWHKTPSLKLVSRPKKMMTRDLWINVYQNGQRAFNSKETADFQDKYTHARIACVKTTINYEVEQED